MELQNQFIFLSGSGGIGQFHLTKTIYNVVSKSLLFNYKEAEKPCVLLLELTGISTVNIGGTTFTLHWKSNQEQSWLETKQRVIKK